METLEYHTRDKSDWGDGPWQNEPDKKQWRDKATGLPCLIVRNNGGALCGYVGVTQDHPLYGKDGDEVDLNVHGGITFAHSCSHGDERNSICHVVQPGEPDNVWWLGFDCAHAFDLCPHPRRTKYGILPDEIYKDFAYVTAEVENLARQLKGGSHEHQRTI